MPWPHIVDDDPTMLCTNDAGRIDDSISMLLTTHAVDNAFSVQNQPRMLWYEDDNRTLVAVIDRVGWMVSDQSRTGWMSMETNALFGESPGE